MGIRYYAYAFDREQSRLAADDPRSILPSDPLADAWGMEPHATVGVTTFEQVSPRRDMLYLDKAWCALQALTYPEPGKPDTGTAYRMFEGAVTMHDLGWHPWVRTILPDEIPSIRDELCAIDETAVRAWARAWRGAHGRDSEAEVRYVLQFLKSAQEYIGALASDDRGMVYLIG